ncbi:site-specific integrase [Lachnospiraceae bacterium OttesenSCG-928-J05]|nr:site-specific integrase [Lachnospiraceae bacterium OttesenSCG-928-J05]
MKTRVYPHKFRHTFGTWGIQEGKDVRLVSLMLGHSSVDTTIKHYCATNIAEMRIAHHGAA